MNSYLAIRSSFISNAISGSHFLLRSWTVARIRVFVHLAHVGQTNYFEGRTALSRFSQVCFSIPSDGDVHFVFFDGSSMGS